MREGIHIGWGVGLVELGVLSFEFIGTLFQDNDIFCKYLDVFREGLVDMVDLVGQATDVLGHRGHLVVDNVEAGAQLRKAGIIDSSFRADQVFDRADPIFNRADPIFNGIDPVSKCVDLTLDGIDPVSERVELGVDLNEDWFDLAFVNHEVGD